MSRDALGTYLGDHLAGSVGAIELIERVIERNSGTPLAAALTGLLAEIEEDQAALRSILERLDAPESALKKAGAWLAEKAARFTVGDGGSPLHRLEMLEMLALGIQGKLALWRALQRVADRHPALAGVDLVTLERRALEQHARVEAHRLEAATGAL